jgi:hypothetical protein
VRLSGGRAQRNYETCLLKLSEMLTAASIPPVKNNAPPSLLARDAVAAGDVNCLALTNGVRGREQKERNMKSKTAGKFHARRLVEKRQTSAKKDSRRRPLE